MAEHTPVVMIGLDAMDAARVDALVERGRLPTLAGLRENGAWGRLRNEPEAFLSMVWPTFYSGAGVGTHGWYYNKMWRPERQRIEFGRPNWIPQRPFWDELRGPRVALLDVPFAPPPGDSFNGIQLNGWQNHDNLGASAYPASLWRDLRRRFGPPRMKPELFGPQTTESLRGLRAEMLACIDQFAAINEHVLRQERWDLFISVFGSAHRAGHYLWDLSQLDASGFDPSTRTQLAGALDEIYEAVDRALRRVLAAAPPDAHCFVFAMHGMDRNTGWVDRFGSMFHHVMHRPSVDGDAHEPSKGGVLYRVKQALPWSFVRQVTTRLPPAVNQALVPIWSARMHDWPNTSAFVLPLDVYGFVRLNIRGRERDGAVSPGTEVDELVARLREGLLSFRDLDTDEPVIAAVDRTDELVGSDAPRRSLLPDLVARWGNLSAHESRGVASASYGELHWPKGVPYASGRAGNHVNRGWLIATGPTIKPGELTSISDTRSIAATALRWLGVEPPDHMAAPLPLPR